MQDNDIWDLVDLPNHFNLIGFKWVFKTKRYYRDNIVRFKARLVTKRFTQREGIDFSNFSLSLVRICKRITMDVVAH